MLVNLKPFRVQKVGNLGILKIFISISTANLAQPSFLDFMKRSNGGIDWFAYFATCASYEFDQASRQNQLDSLHAIKKRKCESRKRVDR